MLSDAVEGGAAVGDALQTEEGKLQSQTFKRESNFSKWWKLVNTTEFYFEFLLLAIHPIPYYEHILDIDIIDMLFTKTKTDTVRYLLCYDFFFALMCFRVYFLVRTIMNFSVFAELHSKQICIKYGFEQSTSFCLKALVTKSPAKTVMFVALISTMFFAYVLRIFER